MKIIEVNNKDSAHEFLMMPRLIYANENHWIQPLDKDINDVFNRNKNEYYNHGGCRRWILRNEKGLTIGRVAAFIDYNTSHKNRQPTGGIGFFECINDLSAAKLLFDTCKIWLERLGMEAMDGPINFGERDRWWGLLTEGFEHDPNYCMTFNPPYYKDIFEAYGFKEYYQQYTYHRKVKGGMDQSICRRAERILNNSSYVFSNINQINLDKVADDFMQVYNQAWVSYSDIEQMNKDQVVRLLNKIKPILDRRLIWFGYYDKKPIAFAIMLPEINGAIKKMSGKFGLLEKLKFLWMKKQGRFKKISGVAFGVIPRFQKRGIESALIHSISQMADDPQKKFEYREIEHNWVGDFNPQMMRVHEMMGGSIKKVHCTFRYLFDRKAEFFRADKVN